MASSSSTSSMAASAATSPVYALIGSDPFLQLEALQDIVAKLGKDAQRADFEGERAELSAVLDELRSFSMFSASKIVVVREADDFISKYREKLEDFFTAIAEGKETVAGSIILRVSSLPSNQRIYKAIAKAGQVLKCDPPPQKDLPGWILARAKKVHRVEIELPAANQLAELIGQDLGRIDSELGKLAIGCENNRITLADVSSTVSFQREQEIYEITALLGRGNGGEAIRRWRELVRSDSSAEFRMITWLGILFENLRLLLRAKETNNPPMAMAAKQARIWDPNVLKETLALAVKLGKSGIARNLDDLTNLDKRIKSGLATPAEGIERFMATIHE